MVTINYRDGRPIYEQVKDDLRRLVVTGAMRPGEKLPSVRELAVSLAINPNTIQRAYHELESEGYIVSVPGKGSFCAQFSPQSDPRREELLARLEETVRELRWLGVGEEEIIDADRVAAGRAGKVGEAKAVRPRREEGGVVIKAGAMRPELVAFFHVMTLSDDKNKDALSRVLIF